MCDTFKMLAALTGRSGPGPRMPRGLAQVVLGDIASPQAGLPSDATPPPGLRLVSVKNKLARGFCWFRNHGSVRGTVAARLRVSPDALAAISEPDAIDAPAP